MTRLANLVIEKGDTVKITKDNLQGKVLTRNGTRMRVDFVDGAKWTTVDAVTLVAKAGQAASASIVQLA